MVSAGHNVANLFELPGNIGVDRMGHITNANPNLVFNLSCGHSPLLASI